MGLQSINVILYYLSYSHLTFAFPIFFFQYVCLSSISLSISLFVIFKQNRNKFSVIFSFILMEMKYSRAIWGEVVFSNGLSSYQIHILYCLDAHQQLKRVFFTQAANRWQHQTAETVGTKSLHRNVNDINVLNEKQALL